MIMFYYFINIFTVGDCKILKQACRFSPFFLIFADDLRIMFPIRLKTNNFNEKKNIL